MILVSEFEDIVGSITRGSMYSLMDHSQQQIKQIKFKMYAVSVPNPTCDKQVHNCNIFVVFCKLLHVYFDVFLMLNLAPQCVVSR